MRFCHFGYADFCTSRGRRFHASASFRPDFFPNKNTGANGQRSCNRPAVYPMGKLIYGSQSQIAD